MASWSIAAQAPSQIWFGLQNRRTCTPYPLQTSLAMRSELSTQVPAVSARASSNSTAGWRVHGRLWSSPLSPSHVLEEAPTSVSERRSTYALGSRPSSARMLPVLLLSPPLFQAQLELLGSNQLSSARLDCSLSPRTSCCHSSRWSRPWLSLFCSNAYLVHHWTLLWAC